MNTFVKVTDSILEQGLLPLFYHKDIDASVAILKALYAAGIRAVEYTNRGDEALKVFEAIIEVRNTDMQDLFLGIGTIKNLKQTIAYLNIGADFIISPGFVAEIASYCVNKKIFYAPGCMTPTEIIAAETAGVHFIKLFPGNVLGPAFLSSIKAVFPNLLFMPTGGVEANEDSIRAWFNAGVCAVGMGSNLVSKKIIDNKEFENITIATKNVIDIINTIKK